MRKFILVIKDLRKDLPVIASGVVVGFIATLWWIAEYGPPPAGNAMLGIAGIMVNVFIIAPFIGVFRSISSSEWWQKYLLLRTPQFAFGLVLGTILGSKGLDPVQLIIWAMGAALATAFFSASPQSRSYQGTQAQQTGLYARCPRLAAVYYMLITVGKHDVGDALLQRVNPSTMEELMNLIDQVQEEFFPKVTQENVTKLKEEVKNFINLNF